jgi:hypothetical protein
MPPETIGFDFKLETALETKNQLLRLNQNQANTLSRPIIKTTLATKPSTSKAL